MEKTAEEEVPKIPFKWKLMGPIIRLTNSFIYRKDGTINRKLQSYFEARAPANSTPVDGVSTRDAVIDEANNVSIRVFLPVQEKADEKKLPVIIYYHGGGFMTNSADSVNFDKVCRGIAKACNSVVVSVDYRRAPEFPFPAAYDDCYKAFDWLRSSESGSVLPATADISQCFLMGDSSGANIAHFMGCRAAENDISPIQLRGMVELQPFFGGEDVTPSELMKKPFLLNLYNCHYAWKAFLPAGANRDHHACNVFGPNSPDISKLSLPPMLVVIGSLDILRDRQARYVEVLKEQGKDVTQLNYAGAYHAFYIIDTGDLAAKVLADVVEFIRARTL